MLAGREHELMRIDTLLGDDRAAGRCSSWVRPEWARRRCWTWPGRGLVEQVEQGLGGNDAALDGPGVTSVVVGRDG